MSRLLRVLWVLSAAAVLATCAGGPTAGELEIHLAAAPTGTRALQFAVSGAESRTVESAAAACTGCRVFTVRVGDRELRGMVVGTLAPGPLLRVLVSDIEEPSAYQAVVVEAADGGYALLPAEEFRLEMRGRR
jgi:hypothetical protein